MPIRMDAHAFTPQNALNSPRPHRRFAGCCRQPKDYKNYAPGRRVSDRMTTSLHGVFSMVTRPRYFRVPAGALLALCMLGATVGQAAETPGGTPEYRVRAGDKLTVSVWKEQELQRQVLVQPDGKISFPLAGQVQAQGKTVEEIRADITTRLARYIPDLVVTVLVDEIRGARVYVLGQVNKANQYVVPDDIDVMQALSMAGGMTAFASPNDIKILRRDGTRQVAFNFRYGDVSRGKDLEQNIVLRDGDVVVVP